jgi:hypothetical protein
VDFIYGFYLWVLSVSFICGFYLWVFVERDNWE